MSEEVLSAEFEFEGQSFELSAETHTETWYVRRELQPCTVRQWRRPGFYDAAIACRKTLLSEHRRAAFRAILAPKTPDHSTLEVKVGGKVRNRCDQGRYEVIALIPDGVRLRNVDTNETIRVGGGRTKDTCLLFNYYWEADA